MPMKVGGKGKMQSYDPATGKFGNGSLRPETQEAEAKTAVVTIESNGRKYLVEGKITEVEPEGRKPDKIEETGENFQRFFDKVNK